MTTDQHCCDTATAGAAVDVHARALAALTTNALALTHTSGPTRRALLLDRAQLWEQLADCSTAASLRHTALSPQCAARKPAFAISPVCHSGDRRE